jgi:hypothetical protein
LSVVGALVGRELRVVQTFPVYVRLIGSGHVQLDRPRRGVQLILPVTLVPIFRTSVAGAKDQISGECWAMSGCFQLLKIRVFPITAFVLVFVPRLQSWFGAFEFVVTSFCLMFSHSIGLCILSCVCCAVSPETQLGLLREPLVSHLMPISSVPALILAPVEAITALHAR